MKKTHTSLIAAVHNSTRAIAVDGEMPWDRPEDLARFQRLTKGDAVLMGRKTYESLPDHVRPLPDRYNIVLSGDEEFGRQVRSTNVIVPRSRKAVLDACVIYERMWVAGGAEVYRQFAGYADDMYITWVWEKEGEDFGVGAAEHVTTFPENAEDLKDSHVFERESYEEHDGYAFEKLTRR